MQEWPTDFVRFLLLGRISVEGLQPPDLFWKTEEDGGVFWFGCWRCFDVPHSSDCRICVNVGSYAFAPMVFPPDKPFQKLFIPVDGLESMCLDDMGTTLQSGNPAFTKEGCAPNAHGHEAQLPHEWCVASTAFLSWSVKNCAITAVMMLSWKQSRVLGGRVHCDLTSCWGLFGVTGYPFNLIR